MLYTTATLYNCPLCVDGSYTVDFASSDARRNWFSQYATHTIQSCTYIRKDNILKVDYIADSLDNAGVNYVSYTNDSGTEIFAFVTSIEYSAQNTAILHLKTDSFITYQFKINRNNVFVEREHVSNDGLFQHTLNEPVSAPYVIPHPLHYSTLGSQGRGLWNSTFDICVFCKEPVKAFPIDVNEFPYIGGMVVPCVCYYLRSTNGILGIINAMNNGKPQYTNDEEEVLTNNVIGLAMGVSSKLRHHEISADPELILPEYLDAVGYIEQDGTTRNLEARIDINYNVIGSHTVRNMKLNCKNTRHFNISNRGNSSIDLEYERITNADGAILLEYCYAFGMNPLLTYYVNEYNGIGGNLTNGITLNDFPQIPYQTDAYNTWLAQNANKLFMQEVTAYTNVASSAATLDIVGAYKGAIPLANIEATKLDAKAQPNMFNGTIGGSLSLSNGTMGCVVSDCYPNEETLEVIDSYYDRFGYNVSKVKTMQWNSRPHYNYIKTNGANIGGQIPQANKAEINTLLDNGLTVWHVNNGGVYGVFDHNNK